MTDVTKLTGHVALGTPTTSVALSKLVMYVAYTSTATVPVPRRSRATVRTRMGAA